MDWLKSKKVLALVLCVLMVACTVDQVLTDLNVLAQIAGAIIPALGVLSPADAAFATKISSIASQGITVIRTDYNEFKAYGATTNLQKLQAAITTLKDNLAAELAAAQVSNPVVVQKVTAWVNLISTTLNSILAALPQPSPTGGKVSAKLTKPVPTKAEIKAQWDANVCKGDAACAALVK